MIEPNNTEPYRRHAEHFLGIWRTAGDNYMASGEAMNNAIALFNTNLPNIRLAQIWASEHLREDPLMMDALAYASSEGCTELAFLFQDPRDSISWIQEAIASSLLPDLWHYIALGRAYYRLGNTDKAHEVYTLAHARAYRTDGEYHNFYNYRTPLPDELCGVMLAYVLEHLGVTCSAKGAFKEATSHLERAVTIFRFNGNERGACRALSNLGDAYLNFIENRQQSHAYRWPLTPPPLSASTITTYAKRALEHFTEALRSADDNHDRRMVGYALMKLGLCYAHLGEPQNAITYYNEAITLLDKLGDTLDSLEVRFYKSMALYQPQSTYHRSNALTLLTSTIVGMKSLNHGLLPRAVSTLDSWEAWGAPLRVLLWRRRWRVLWLIAGTGIAIGAVTLLLRDLLILLSYE